jgi:hypothetical protein
LVLSETDARFPFSMINVFLFLFLIAGCFAVGQSLSWIDQQYNASLQMLLDNIFMNGTVIASPSRAEPDYYVFSLIAD